MKIYLGGTIAGDPLWRGKLKEQMGRMGHIVLDPFVLPQDTATADRMHISEAMLDSADAICLPQDWAETPAGAKFEGCLTGLLGKRIIHVDMIQGPVRRAENG